MIRRVVVVPCRNEAATIFDLVQATLEHCEIVVVANDGSMDATAEEAARAGAAVLNVPPSRPGLAGTYRWALDSALQTGGDAFVEMDAGGSHNPAELPRFWGALQRGADVAAGRRFGGDGASYSGHWRRKGLSFVGTRVTHLLLGTTFHDSTSGFVAYTPEALGALLALPWRARGHYYQTEMRLRALDLGLNVVEVPISYKNSGSSLNWGSIKEAANLVLP